MAMPRFVQITKDSHIFHTASSPGSVVEVTSTFPSAFRFGPLMLSAPRLALGQDGLRRRDPGHVQRRVEFAELRVSLASELRMELRDSVQAEIAKSTPVPEAKRKLPNTTDDMHTDLPPPTPFARGPASAARAPSGRLPPSCIDFYLDSLSK